MLFRSEDAVGIIKACVDDEFPAVTLSALQALMDISIDDCMEGIDRIISGGDEDITMEAMYMLGKEIGRASCRERV